MAFHTFCTADLFHGHTVHFLVLQVFVEFLVDAVELVSTYGANIDPVLAVSKYNGAKDAVAAFVVPSESIIRP